MPELAPLPFLEAIAWARARGVVLPETYYGELQGLARAMAFSIAGLSKLDQLQAVMDSLTDATENGESFQTWAKRVTDPDGGIRLDLPAHRIENIFRTNVQGHYARGRCEQQKRNVASHPWLMYDAINDSRTRPSHAALDGMIARHDDPIWRTHRVPNGYQCRCRIIALSERQAGRYIEADRKRMEDPEYAKARAEAKPDKGWDYDLCAEPTEGLRRAINGRRQGCNSIEFAKKKRKGISLPCQPPGGDYLDMLEAVAASGGKMPEPRSISGVERLSSALPEEALLARFMREFGTEEREDFTDKAGNALLIDRRLFQNLKGGWKIMKGERAPWLLYTAINIKTPDEIWLEPGRGGGPDKLYFLSRFVVGRTDQLSCIAVFEREQGAKGAWVGRTNYATARDDGYIESKREGQIVLVYRRREQ